MELLLYIEEAGAKGLPLSPAPEIPADPASPSLRTNLILTIPNTFSTITIPASVRSDCCSPSLRNAVRLPSGIDVHLHRNTHRERRWTSAAATPARELVRSKRVCHLQPRSSEAGH